MKNRKKSVDKQARFAIRKLSIGAVSVLISTSIYLGLGSNDVLADTNSSNDSGEVTNNNSESIETKNINVVSASEFQNEGLDNNLAESKVEQQSSNSASNPDQPSEQLMTSAPVYTTQGQMPPLDVNNMFTADQLEEAQIDTNSPKTTATWVQKPDVSKIGNASGTAKLSYEDFNADPTTNDQGEDVYPLKDITVNVPVLVRKAEQEANQDQVKNSLNIINTTDNSLVAHYEWIGAKVKNDDEEEPMPNSDSISEDITNMLQSLGFEMDDYSYFPTDITEFGTKNKVATIFVKPSSTAPVITDTPYFTYGGGDTSSINNVTETPDPASYIGNLGTLPAGTKIEWNVAPEYNTQKDEDGNWISEAPTNDPSIKVTLPGKDPIILKASSDDIPLKDIATLPAYGNGTLLIKSDNQVKVGDKVGSPLDYVTNLDQYLKSDHAPEDVQAFKDSFKWTVAPNTQQAGYTLGAFTYDNSGISYGGNMILFKVNPTAVNNSKTITRTITFEGLPQDLIPKVDPQTVTFTQNGEQTYVDEPIEWKTDDNTWKAIPINTITANNVVYTPTITIDGKVVNSINEVTVNPDTKDSNVIVTYQKSTTGDAISEPAKSVATVVIYQTKDGKEVKTDVKKQKSGDKVDFNVPEGYVPVDELPDVTVTSDMKPITITVIKKETATGTPETTPVKSVATVVIYQTKDGEEIKTDVKEQQPGDKVEFNVPGGYVPVDKLPEVTVTSDMSPIKIIVVKKETATDTPEIVSNNKVASVVIYQTEDGKVVKTDIKEQQPGDKVEFNIPEGYVPADKLPEVTVTSDMSPITIIVVKKKTATDTPLVENDPVKVVINYQDQNGKVVKMTDEDHNTGDRVKVDVPEGYVPTTTIPDLVATPSKSSITENTNSHVTLSSANKKDVEARSILPKTGSKSVLAEALLGLILLAGSATLEFISKRKKN
ncbi:YSIRK-type signal peptide-containing protein [Lactobacillus agrestimuris]|uniref:YSIRK-type signal peptide-containing protein n=1 Tax=Lactobacillus agrestimuris TaxID=2941328 RepID=UPI00204397B0|nr:YSIRK-type signal peptide-containing protein [Lactobacillus agrestimuris]